MFFDLVQKSRSCRKFDEGFLFTKKDLAELVSYTCFAPSSVNLQPLKYRLIFKQEETGRIFPLTKWAGLIKNEKLPPAGHHPTGYILICHDLSIHPSPDNFQRDVGICAQTIMLAAAEKGLGGCMIGSFDKEAMTKELALPETLCPMLLLALGKPEDHIVLTDAENGNVTYFRENGTQYVPKRTTDEIIL